MGGAVSVASLDEQATVQHAAALEVVETMVNEMEDGSKKTKDEIADVVAAHEGNTLTKEEALELLAKIGDGENDEYEKEQLAEYLKAAKAPAEGEAAPAEGEAAPAEGEAAPAEGEAAPAEGEAAEAAPAEAEAAAEGEEGEAAKTEEAAPAEGEAPAASA
mmetsp:Transcript_18376/g.29571  ORF Transcript_18376/g.29571 Transcript_18376/m.29571 type:complete len:161 (-) Transcript_18376:248-730(-)|eukprot:CAMPEP_0171497608 /NCGR_PEP_ID=MMETSP0958-20121227/7369_1 /TAXON_ID=87120 /ORGANISM="Aurantiochytrium limacinum, Strain ATCCMYA-1381" /LENGTH=160 /DNA_ID=CAMNT_0012031875 /DNA_START=137 /DNA_END=619 /DNA_ORIENTATION=+